MDITMKEQMEVKFVFRHIIQIEILKKMFMNLMNMYSAFSGSM